jgi:hypothetical protein
MCRIGDIARLRGLRCNTGWLAGHVTTGRAGTDDYEENDGW